MDTDTFMQTSRCMLFVQGLGQPNRKETCDAAFCALFLDSDGRLRRKSGISAEFGRSGSIAPGGSIGPRCSTVPGGTAGGKGQQGAFRSAGRLQADEDRRRALLLPHDGRARVALSEEAVPERRSAQRAHGRKRGDEAQQGPGIEPLHIKGWLYISVTPRVRVGANRERPAAVRVR